MVVYKDVGNYGTLPAYSNTISYSAKGGSHYGDTTDGGTADGGVWPFPFGVSWPKQL